MQRKRPLHGKIFARCIPKRLFAGLFGCMARISCQSQLILDTRRRYAATNWRFSRPRPLSGCMERKTCHGLPPGDAFREHFANRAASSCGRCCVREKGARHPVHGDETLSRWLATERKVGGTLSSTWRGALNAGIRAEGADDKLAHALHPNRLAPFAQAGLRPLHESTVT